MCNMGLFGKELMSLNDICQMSLTPDRGHVKKKLFVIYENNFLIL